MDWMASLQGLVGGVLIGLSAVWLMGALGRIAGISGIIGNLITQRPKGDSAWRLAFVVGLVSGPLLVMAMGGGLGNVADAPGVVIGPRWRCVADVDRRSVSWVRHRAWQRLYQRPWRLWLSTLIPAIDGRHWGVSAHSDRHGLCDASCDWRWCMRRVI